MNTVQMTDDNNVVAIGVYFGNAEETIIVEIKPIEPEPEPEPVILSYDELFALYENLVATGIL